MIILRFLSSLHLTLALLLGLSAISVIGTIKPGALGRYDLFYQSIWFRSILALLALHLCVCTVKTILRNLGDRRRFLDLLGGEQVFGLPLRYVLPDRHDVKTVGEGMRQLGYRIYPRGERFYARKNPWGRWGSTIVHLSFLGIMLGALLAETGFVGTLNIYVGDKSSVYFDWEDREKRPLPFEFRLDYFEPLYYPIELRFGVLDPRGNRLEAYAVKEGDTVRLPLKGHTARVVKFLPHEKQIVLGLYRNGRYLGEYRASAAEKRYAGEEPLPISFVPLAYKDPVLRQVRSDVSILKNGRVVEQGTISINHPLTYDGVSIYQTAFDRDKFGSWYAGFRFSRDPGEPVVWVGCLFMVLGLGIAFLVPFRAVGVSRVDGELVLVALVGFRGDSGRRDFERLESRLADILET